MYNKSHRILILNILSLIFIFSSCQHSKNIDGKMACNFNQYISESKTFTTSSRAFQINAGNLIQKSNGRNESKCIGLMPNDPKGFKINIPDLKTDEVYNISIWRLQKSELSSLEAKAGEGTGKIHITQSKAHIIDSKGWEQISLYYSVPPHLEGHELQVFISNQSLDTVYFDDLEITKNPTASYPRYGHENTMYIYVDTLGHSFLNKKRAEFFTNGYFTSDSSDNIPTIVFSQGTAIKGKLRLKGQDKNRFIGSKWGLRVDLGNQGWNYMTEFSLSNPEFNGMADEIFLHRWLAIEKILTTSNGIVPVAINSKSIGSMMYEQEFEPSYFFSNKLYPGLIFRLSNKAWLKAKTQKYKYLPDQFYYAADIEIYSRKKSELNSDFHQWLSMAQNLCFQWKYNFEEAHIIFNSDKVARLLAITDLSRSWQCLHWDNLKFYYNPINEKLELIGQDFKSPKTGFPDHMVSLADICLDTNFCQGMPQSFLRDKIISEKYLIYLKKYSSESYLDSLEIQIKNSLQTDLAYLRKEFPSYKFEFGQYRKQAKAIRKNIVALEKQLPLKFSDQTSKNEELNQLIPINIYPDFVKIYPEKERNGKRNIFIRNFLPTTIFFKGTSTNNSLLINTLKKDLAIAPFSSLIVYDIAKHHNFYFFATSSDKTNFFCQESGLPSPKNFGNLQSVTKNYTYSPQIKNNKENKTILFEGNLVIRKPIYIPSGFKVIIKAGASIDFLNRSFILSASPINAIGFGLTPIEFYSSDGTGQGIAIQNASDISKFEFCIFKILQSPNFKGWRSPGTLNFIETTAEVNNVEFLNCKSEAAIFAYHSSGTISRTQIKMQNGSGIKTYYSNFNIAYNIINNAEMDAFNLVSGIIKIDTCSIFECKTGIAANFQCITSINQSIISKSAIGVISNNGSLININNSSIKQCSLSISTKNDMPEFAPGQLVSINLRLTENQNNFMPENQSTINWNGKIIKP